MNGKTEDVALKRSVEPSDSDKLSEVALLFNGMDGVIHSLYETLDQFGSEGSHAYSLVMALEALNNQVGRHCSCI